MRQSQLFTKTSKTNPAGEASANAQLLERAGFVHKNSAGVYSFLPLGWRVMQKIAQIIREEMDGIGGQEIFMPALVEKKYLDATGRWDVEVGFEARGKKDKEAGFVLGWTHEEVLTEIATRFVNSYKDLPFSAYQIQTKFRNEARAKSGLLRGREFMMKDLYSFHSSEQDLQKFYEIVRGAYHKIFERCGLDAIYTLAAGGDFTANYTHEFQVAAAVGEDTIYLDRKKKLAVNKEVYTDEAAATMGLKKSELEEVKAIEVGNIFPLGTKYSKAFNLYFTKEDGSKELVVMGSYGIGLGRLMATAAEVFHDERGIIWPVSVAPFQAHLLALGVKADETYSALHKAGIEVLYDDREASAGVKFADADLIGIPWRVVVSEKTEKAGKVEVKMRNEAKTEFVDPAKLAQIIKK